MREYTKEQIEKRRKAVEKYQLSVDRINCQLPKGTKEKIKNLTGMSCNSFIKECVLGELDKIEKYKTKYK